MELKVHDQEIRLQKLWKSGKLFQQKLVTASGHPVEVLYAGTENFDSGPDFKDAIILLNENVLKGDIEVHLDADGWYAHQHHKDPAYNKVILHLVSKNKSDRKLIEREDGVPVQQLFVDPNDFLKKTQSKRSFSNSMKSLIIQECPLSETNEQKMLTTIEVAAQQRLEEKVAQVRERYHGLSWDQLIYEKIMEALGYSKNQAQFRSLAKLIPFDMIFSEMQWVSEERALKKCAALLFGGAGLLPSQNPKREAGLNTEILEYIAPLEYLWDQMSHRLEIKPMHPHNWQFFRLRPQNFPTRRIAGMVEIISRFYRDGFLATFQKIFSGNAEDYKQLITELESVMISKTKGFWASHYRFEDPVNDTRKSQANLIGKDRARDIIVNTVIPTMLLYSLEGQDGSLRNLVQELFGRFPRLAENNITRAMRAQLFRGGKAKSIRSARQQQGLLYLHKLYCKPLRCSECMELSRT